MKKLFPFLAAALCVPAGAESAHRPWPDLSTPLSAQRHSGDSALVIGLEGRRTAGDWLAYFSKGLRIPKSRAKLVQDSRGLQDAARKLAAGAKETFWVVLIARRDSDAIPLPELLKIVSAGRQKRAVVLVDASFADAGKPDAGTVLLTAAGPGENPAPLPFSDPPRPGFAYLALGALRGWGANPDGTVTAWSLVDMAGRKLGTPKPRLMAGSPGAILGRGSELEPFPEPAPEPGPRPAPPKPSGGAAPIDWVRIAGGSFTMGSETGAADEKPARQATVQDFEMARSPVTFGQYQSCVDAGACAPPHVDDGRCEIFEGGSWKRGVLPENLHGPDRPAVCVDWAQAAAFSSWAGGRLPSEAEWEFAASKLDGMTGVVLQWTADAYHESYDGAPSDGSAWEKGGVGRTARGSSWAFGDSRASARNHADPGDLSAALGFRPARAQRSTKAP